MTIYHLRNKHGIELLVTNYGATIISLYIPDRTGHFNDVVLGMDSIEDYEAGTPYFGAVIGRYANRISDARFEIDGIPHKLSTNEGTNQLHGGPKGFDKVNWAITPFATQSSQGLRLSFVSPDGDQGFPGALSVSGSYELSNDNKLTITFEAATSKPTHVNISHHSYFNLAGVGEGDIMDHELTIAADTFLPIDSQSIPTGEFRPVDRSPFDFRTSNQVGARLKDDNEQLNLTGGFDHNYVLSNFKPGQVNHAATLFHPTSSRMMKLYTSEPGLQFYTGNNLDGSLKGKGTRYTKHAGLCLEPQHFPNTPNQFEFPSTLLYPGETYRTQSIFEFLIA